MPTGTAFHASHILPYSFRVSWSHVFRRSSTLPLDTIITNMAKTQRSSINSSCLFGLVPGTSPTNGFICLLMIV